MINFALVSDSDLAKKIKNLQTITENMNATIKKINALEEPFEKVIRALDEELHRLGLLWEEKMLPLPLKKQVEEICYKLEEELGHAKNYEDALKGLHSLENRINRRLEGVTNYLVAQELVLDATEKKLLPGLRELKEGNETEDKFLQHAIAIYRSGRALLKNQLSINLAEARYAERLVLEDHLARIQRHVRELEREDNMKQQEKEVEEPAEEKQTPQEEPKNIRALIREVNDLVGEINLMQKFTRENLPAVTGCLEAFATEVFYFQNILPAGQKPLQEWKPGEVGGLEYFTEPISGTIPMEEECNKLNKQKANLGNYKAVLNLFFMEIDSIHWFVNYEVVPALKFIWTYYESLGCGGGIEILGPEDFEEAIKTARKFPWQEDSNSVLERKHLLLIHNAANYLNVAYKTLNKVISILNRPLKEFNFDIRREALNEFYILDKVRTELRLYIPHQKNKKLEGKRLKDNSRVFRWDKMMKYW